MDEARSTTSSSFVLPEAHVTSQEQGPGPESADSAELLLKPVASPHRYTVMHTFVITT